MLWDVMDPIWMNESQQKCISNEYTQYPQTKREKYLIQTSQIKIANIHKNYQMYT